jgi:phosphopantetheine attachment domain protein
MKSPLEHQIISVIIDRLGLDIEVDSVDVDAPLFEALATGTKYENSSLNLDSIDVLEVVLAIKSTFNVELPDDQPDIFTSIKTLAEYIDSHRSI